MGVILSVDRSRTAIPLANLAGQRRRPRGYVSEHAGRDRGQYWFWSVSNSSSTGRPISVMVSRAPGRGKACSATVLAEGRSVSAAPTRDPGPCCAAVWNVRRSAAV